MNNTYKLDQWVVEMPPVIVDNEAEAAELIEKFGGQARKATRLCVYDPMEKRSLADDDFAGSVVR